MSVIAFTFAGREKRMSLQVNYMRQALKQNSFDQWHIWNFARNPDDREWLQKEFKDCYALHTSATSLKYFLLSSPKSASCKYWVKAQNDAHIIIQMKSGELYELVLGAFSNTKHLLRWFPTTKSFKQHAAPIKINNGSLIWSRMNEIKLDCSHDLMIHLNEVEIFKVKINNSLDCIENIFVHTGYGSEGFWDTNINSKIKLINTFSAGYEGFKATYHYYSNSYYCDDLFVKMDDDIIYCDLKKIDAFIDAVKESKGSDIISANVINNGVCGYFQCSSGYFSSGDLVFDYPADGLCGKLWESATLCSKLHNYFLNNLAAMHNIATRDKPLIKLPDFDRFSINFIAFKHTIFAYMSAAYYSDKSQNDDEYIMTKILPKLFGVKKYIFTHLLVSHLSFFKQEESLDADYIIDAYSKLDKI
jgi:hypothetical protein